ncbi:TRAP transporter substrate-binding protein DctP [Microbacterium sp.]|uniref:TRAP transporter substrate-binding protein DctP n=1 Tax=Microbacterium sp. TaxID=51671 RepID=UPI003A8C104E
MQRKPTLALALAVPAVGILVAGCSGGGGGTGGDSGDGNVTLRVATSQPETQPNYYCGVELLKERLEAADIGLTVELFPNSQLGPDTERLASLQAGDEDVDLLGSGNLATIYEPMGVVEAAYAWDSVDALFTFLDGPDGDELKANWEAASGTTAIDAWLYGVRTFSTVDAEIRSPEDLASVPIRFPDTPQYLANAEAMGANAVTVSYEELYLALQQGIVKGQENPIPGSHTASYDEIVNTFNLNNHQYSLHWVTVSNKTLDQMNDQQKELLTSTVKELRGEVLDCVNKDTEDLLAQYRDNPDMTVVEEDEIDLAAFRSKAEDYFSGYYTGESLDLYTTIREQSGN